MRIKWNDYPNFTAHELRCKGFERGLPCTCRGASKMDPVFMERLQFLRSSLNTPLLVNSGYRCPAYNNHISTTGPDGPHTSGKAVDIQARGLLAYELIKAALNAGFTGIGVQQKNDGRFLHLDLLADWETPGPRPWIWSY